MSETPDFTRVVASLPASRPFVAPEALGRRVGRPVTLRLGANESAFGPPPGALAAMSRELEHTAWYGDPESADLREALAARHGCRIENITVGSGIDDLLGLVVRAFLSPGDASVATLGTYPTYSYHVIGYGARLETVAYADGGRVDLDALVAKAHATRARVIYLANPDNPSGTFASRGDVESLMAALPNDTLLALDEAYGDFVSRAELPGEEIDPRVVRMRTFSKAYGLAGARIAYALASERTIAAFEKIRLHFGVNRTAQIGALAALADDAFVAGVTQEVARGRAEYAALASRHGLSTIASRTNFVCIDLGSRERAERMVEGLLQRGVFIRKPGAAPLDGHIRVTVGTARDRAGFADAFADAFAQELA